MKKPNQDSQNNLQANLGDGTFNVMNNYSINLLKYSSNLEFPDKTSAEIDEIAICREDYFKQRFGFVVNQTQREHIITFKQEKNTTDDVIKLGFKNKVLIVTNEGVMDINVKLIRFIKTIGMFLFVILLAQTGINILTFHAPSGLAKDQLIGWLIFSIFYFGMTIFLRIIFIEPANRLKELV